MTTAPTRVDAAKAAGVLPGTIWTSRESGHLFPVTCVAEDAAGNAVVVYRLHPMHETERVNSEAQARTLTEFLTLFVRR